MEIDSDEEFYNDPELHKQLDQVENHYRLTQEPTPKRLKQNNNTQNNNQNIYQTQSTSSTVIHNPRQLIHSVIIRLFHSFVTTLRSDLTPQNTTLLPSLHVILDAAQPLSRDHPNLKPDFHALVLELFACLASAFQPDQTRPTTLTQLSGPSRPSGFSFANNKDDASLMKFVVRLGTLFIQISALLSRTNLIEAQTQAIHVLTVLVQTSPLFTSCFLHHPDFDNQQDPGRIQQQPNLLLVLLTYFDLLDRTRTAARISSSPDSSSQSPPLASPQDNSAPRSPSGSYFTPPLHLALLDLIEALIWDPPEACHPVLEKFLKSNGQAFFQFLLVGPHQAGGIPETEEDLILTSKSIDVLISLASKTGFSKIVLDARVHESSSVPSQPNPAPSNANGHPTHPQHAKTLPSKPTANQRPTATPSKRTDDNKATAEKPETDNTMTAVDRLMKIFLLAATNLELCRSLSADVQTNSRPPIDCDRPQLKVKILSLLHLLAVSHHDRLSTGDLASDEWTGWQALAQAGSFIFSVLIKTIFVDSYRLWNVDGAVKHRLLVPQYVERIDSSIEIIHKMVFHQPSAPTSSPNCTSTKTPLNLINRLKQESPLFAAALCSLSSSLPAAVAGEAPSFLIIGTHHNIYHQFVLAFSKLAWLDFLTPPSDESAFAFPSDPVHTHFGRLFNVLLPAHLFAKLDLIADLAYDVLSSVASPDELDDWKRSALDDDSDDDSQ